MKTLGIYGDSFADVNYMDWAPAGANYGLGWPELLYKKFKTRNYAVGGTGVYFSYKNFLENHHKFDINLFLISHYSRFSVFLPDVNKHLHVVPSFFKSTVHLTMEHSKNHPNDQKVYKAVIDYIDYIMNVEKEKEMSKLMVAEIRRLRPDTVFMDVFRESNTPSLAGLSTIELARKGLGITQLRMEGYTVDMRKCHFTEENNYMIYEKIIAALEQGKTEVTFSEEDLREPVIRPLIDYFKKDDRRAGNI